MTIEKLMTPVGRIVWGHPGRSTKKTDQRTKQPILKDGQPVEQWSFGVAFSKQDFQQYILPYMQQEAATAYPHGVPSNFSWKYKDGDGVDQQGKPLSAREGYAGCYVLNISTEAFAPPIFKFENGSYRAVEGTEIKCGDYVALNLNLKVNVPQSPTHTPGLYVNPNAVEFVGYGQEIVSVSTDPNEMFGGRQHQLPPGASAVPMSSAPAGAAMPGMMPQPGQPPMGNGYAQPAMPPQLPPVGMPAPGAPHPSYTGQPAPMSAYPSNPAPLPPPAHDFVQNAGYPAAVATPPGYAQPPQMGNAAPYAGQPGQPTQPGQPQQPGYPSATPATGYPNTMPGLPPQR